MPHLALRGRQLDDAYPPLAVPEEEDLPDLMQDSEDGTLQRGMEQARQISEEARDQGRKRKMSPITTTTANRVRAQKERPEDEANLVEDFEATKVATSRSALGRRRSEKGRVVPSQDIQDGSGIWHGKNPRKAPSDDLSMPVDVCTQFSSSVSDSCSCVLHRVVRAALQPRLIIWDYQF